jgi:hypothetical protein
MVAESRVRLVKPLIEEPDSHRQALKAIRKAKALFFE